MDELAILGGSKAVNFSESELKSDTLWPQLGDSELSAVNALFIEADISTHPVIRELESAYAKRIGMAYSLAHNNGTSALMASFWALDLNPGDQILVPTATFWASALPMMWHGLVPIFCESEPNEAGLDLDDVKAKWNPRVKAIVIVPLWGIPGNYGQIIEFAKSKNLKIIEDASHAHGATFKNQPVGSFGDISVFSLQGDKLAPAGEGGILLTNDYDLYERAILFGDITRIIELETPARRFAATSFGIKTRIASVSAAIGLSSLKKLDDTNAIRKKNMLKLSSALESYGFCCYRDNEKWSRTYFEFTARVEIGEKNSLSSEEWVAALLAEGCQVSNPRYPLLHEQPFFTEGAFKKVLRISEDLIPDYLPGGFDKTRKINETMIKFPCFTTNSESVLNSYIEAVHKIGRNQSTVKNAMKGAI